MKIKRHIYQNEAGEGGGQGEGAPPAANPATAANPTGVVPDFTSLIPEEFRGHPTLTDIKDVSGLVKSYVSAQAMVGNRIAIPAADAPPEALNEFYTKLGRPEAPDKYAFKPTVPEGMTVDEGMDKFARELFHKAGLTQKQAEMIYNGYNDKSIEDYTNYNTLRTSTEQQVIDGLKAEWGNEFDAKLDRAKYAARTLGGQPFLDFLNETGAGNHPAFLKTFERISAMLKEDTQFRESVNGGGFTSGPQEAQMELARLQGDKEFMKQYTTASDPMHKQAKARMTQLYATAYPGQIQT
jgi:hypothetical protein